MSQFTQVSQEFFSPPTETRNWFHQGPILDDTGIWKELDFSEEFWAEDANVLRRPQLIIDFLNSLPNDVRYSALRTVRGNLIRKELYALDNSSIQDRPYTVAEYLYGVIPLPIGQPWSLPTNPPDQWRRSVFFPCKLAERSTQWERGIEPLTRVSFSDNYDEYGQPQSLINIAGPRGRDYRVSTTSDVEPYLSTQVITSYAKLDDNNIYIVNRRAKTTEFEIKNSGKTDAFTLKDAILSNQTGGGHEPSIQTKVIIGQTLNFYDGLPFKGLQLGEIGNYGALVRTETLALTQDILRDAYKFGESSVNLPYFDFQSPAVCALA